MIEVGWRLTRGPEAGLQNQRGQKKGYPAISRVIRFKPLQPSPDRFNLCFFAQSISSEAQIEAFSHRRLAAFFPNQPTKSQAQQRHQKCNFFSASFTS